MTSRSSLALEGGLLNRAWIQWVALGVDAVAEPDDSVVDLEALIAVTAELGDADTRLRDVSTDWCVAFGRYVNGSRLRQIVRELGTPREAIGEYVATVAAAGGPAWPMAARPRPGYARRARARLDSATTQSRLAIRLRAAFGVNTRADVLAALLDAPRAGLSVADLARRTRFTKPAVADAIDALALAELVATRVVGNERRVTLSLSQPILPGLAAPIHQPDWASRYRVVLAVRRFLDVEWSSTTVRAIEARRLVEPLQDVLTTEEMPRPGVDALGGDFSLPFDRWVADLGLWLREPKRA